MKNVPYQEGVSDWSPYAFYGLNPFVSSKNNEGRVRNGDGFTNGFRDEPKKLISSSKKNYKMAKYDVTPSKSASKTLQKSLKGRSIRLSRPGLNTGSRSIRMKRMRGSRVKQSTGQYVGKFATPKYKRKSLYDMS